ncbi:DUF805 domain-containing protein [Brevibacterium spongiae]|uniref:DUF805 domain-containing protein n=1 Tax=Brevibacterium spongiae TaxID=2909672 RepID=A0ABY5SRF9_9MICO|nr:DUF805 domain-containing protein [Brevibacterium spongiae]UVI35701.1 DUF805 domain-containing protein [Brevibacterium spongiae]
MKVTMSYDANAAYNSDSDVPGPGMPGGQGYDGLEYGGSPRGAASPDDLSLPLYGATFGQAVKRFFKNYVKFSGRASRSEFWFAYLFTILVGIIPMILGFAGSMIATLSASGDSYNSTPPAGATALMATAGILLLVTFLATIIPYIAVCWRRLHDANLAGPFYFLLLIPFFGVIIFIVLMVMEPKPEGQRFDR